MSGITDTTQRGLVVDILRSTTHAANLMTHHTMSGHSTTDVLCLCIINKYTYLGMSGITDTTQRGLVVDILRPTTHATYLWYVHLPDSLVTTAHCCVFHNLVTTTLLSKPHRQLP